MEAVVGHHRDDYAVAAESTAGSQVDRSKRDQLVAIYRCAAAVGGKHSVAVTIEGEAEIMPTGHYRGGQRLDVSRSDAVVDVAAIGLVADHRHRRAEATEYLGANAVGRAVRAVEQQTYPSEIKTGEARLERAQVILLRSVEFAHTANLEPGAGAGFDPRLNRLLGCVCQLEAVSAEELDPIVLIRVMRSGHDDADVEAVLGDKQRRRGGWQHAAKQRLAAGRGDPCSQRRFEHLAGLARVANHEHARASTSSLLGRRAPERQRQLGRQLFASEPANTVGAKEMTSH